MKIKHIELYTVITDSVVISLDKKGVSRRCVQYFFMFRPKNSSVRYDRKKNWVICIKISLWGIYSEIKAGTVSFCRLLEKPLTDRVVSVRLPIWRDWRKIENFEDHVIFRIRKVQPGRCCVHYDRLGLFRQSVRGRDGLWRELFTVALFYRISMRCEPGILQSISNDDRSSTLSLESYAEIMATIMDGFPIETL